MRTTTSVSARRISSWKSISIQGMSVTSSKPKASGSSSSSGIDARQRSGQRHSMTRRATHLLSLRGLLSGSNA